MWERLVTAVLQSLELLNIFDHMMIQISIKTNDDFLLKPLL